MKCTTVERKIVRNQIVQPKILWSHQFKWKKSKLFKCHDRVLFKLRGMNLDVTIRASFRINQRVIVNDRRSLWQYSTIVKKTETPSHLSETKPLRYIKKLISKLRIPEFTFKCKL